MSNNGIPEMAGYGLSGFAGIDGWSPVLFGPEVWRTSLVVDAGEREAGMLLLLPLAVRFKPLAVIVSGDFE